MSDTGYRFLEPQALARVKNLAMVARGVVEGAITGLHSSPLKGFSVEFAEHREYTAGDDPRHLDYKMLARTDRLYIKQYEEETNMRVQILLDISGSMGYSYDGRVTKLEYGSYLTAMLAYLMTRQQDAVGLTTFDTEIRLDMPARSSPRHFNEMMHQLESLPAGRRPTWPTRCTGWRIVQEAVPDRVDQRPVRRSRIGGPRAAPLPPPPPRGDRVPRAGQGGDRFSLQGRHFVLRPGDQASGSRSTRPTSARHMCRRSRPSSRTTAAVARKATSTTCWPTPRPPTISCLTRYIAKRNRHDLCRPLFLLPRWPQPSRWPCT